MCMWREGDAVILGVLVPGECGRLVTGKLDGQLVIAVKRHLGPENRRERPYQAGRGRQPVHLLAEQEPVPLSRLPTALLVDGGQPPLERLVLVQRLYRARGEQLACLRVDLLGDDPAPGRPRSGDRSGSGRPVGRRRRSAKRDRRPSLRVLPPWRVRSWLLRGAQRKRRPRARSPSFRQAPATDSAPRRMRRSNRTTRRSWSPGSGLPCHARSARARPRAR